jgi:hypothetical protein
MTRSERLAKRVERLGGKYEEDWCEINIDAPAGKRWMATETHFLLAEIGAYDSRSQAVDSLTREVSMGLEDCPNPECDCHGR